MAEMPTSMADQLRHEACHTETDETLEHVAKLMRESADELEARQAEIERLRGDSAANLLRAKEWAERYGALEAERDALRDQAACVMPNTEVQRRPE